MDRSEWKQYILETYHAVSDRPWPRHPNHEVFRHPGNQKWFALMMEVPGEKLGRRIGKCSTFSTSSATRC